MYCTKCGMTYYSEIPLSHLCKDGELSLATDQVNTDSKDQRIAELEAKNVRLEGQRSNWQASCEQNQKRISELESALAKAAMEINCAGPVDHRIRVLKDEWSERIRNLEAANSRLRSCLKHLVDQMDKVHGSDSYRAVWELSYLHNGPYAGPKYTDELEAAKRELEK